MWSYRAVEYTVNANSLGHSIIKDPNIKMRVQIAAGIVLRASTTVNISWAVK